MLHETQTLAATAGAHSVVDNAVSRKTLIHNREGKHYE